MEGIYIEPTNCATCSNYLDGELDPILCKSCLRVGTRKVKILKVGVGKYGDKVVILLDNGTIKTVCNHEISGVKE